MLDFYDWVKAQRIGTFINGLLTIAACGLVIVLLYPHKEPDIKPQKLDTVKDQPILKGEKLMANRYRWTCELIRVIDGDTLEAWILLDFGVKLEAKLRLEGINTPEIHTVKTNTEEYKKGIKAKEFVEARFKNCGPKFYIETAGKRPGKYGRYVVNVLLASGEYLDALLLKAGHAVKKEY